MAGMSRGGGAPWAGMRRQPTGDEMVRKPPVNTIKPEMPAKDSIGTDLDVMTTTCPRCGAKNFASMANCGRCGAPLRGARGGFRGAGRMGAHSYGGAAQLLAMMDQGGAGGMGQGGGGGGGFGGGVGGYQSSPTRTGFGYGRGY